jgi:hypothetical protein
LVNAGRRQAPPPGSARRERPWREGGALTSRAD